MPKQFYKMILLFQLLFTVSCLLAQPGTAQIHVSGDKDFSLVYDIHVNTTNKNPGIEETYNGSTKTILHQKGITRIRMVSLMRIQNIYIYDAEPELKKVIITKESGKNLYKYVLTASDWKLYNARYDNIGYAYFKDTINILGFTCKKAILNINNGKQQITAYYTESIKSFPKSIEPMFAGLPGLVLRYELKTKNGSIRYTANKISFEQLDNAIFTEPVKGFMLKQYKPHAR